MSLSIQSKNIVTKTIQKNVFIIRQVTF